MQFIKGPGPAQNLFPKDLPSYKIVCYQS